MGQKAKFRIPVTDPVSGQVYQIPWNSDTEPTKWDIQAALEQIREREKFAHPKSEDSLIPSELEIGNKLLEKGIEEARKPVYRWETGGPDPVPNRRRQVTIPESMKDEGYLSLPGKNTFLAPPERRKSSAQTITFDEKLPILSNVADWFRRRAPSQVENPDAFANLVKANAAGFAGAMSSDLGKPASIAFNLAGLRGTQQWMKAAIAANRARKAAKGAEPLITKEVVEILRTAPQGSPEWLKAANKSLKAIGIDAFPGVPLDADIKLVPHNARGLRQAAMLEQEAAKAGKKIKGLKPNEVIVSKDDLGNVQRKIREPKPKQVNLEQVDQPGLDLTGKAISKGPEVGPDVRHTRAYTIKLQNKDLDFTRDILPILQSYVDRRGSGDMIREMVGRRFNSLRKRGMQAIHDYNAGNREGLLKEIQQMIDEDFRNRRIVGDTSKYKWNYLPQMWDNTPEEIQAVFGLKNPPKKMNIAGGEMKRRAGINPDFLKQSFFQNYAAGMERGLKPKFDNIVDLVADYMTRSNKFQADKGNLNFLKANKLVAKEGSKLARERGYVIVEGMPTFRGKDGTIGHWAVEPNTAKYLANYFSSPHPAAKWVGNWSNLAKALAMGAGVPKTILNAHGFNIMKSAWDMGGPRGLLDFVTTGITERGARKHYEKIFSNPTNLKNLLDLTKHGYVGNIAEDFRNLGGKTGLEFGDTLRASKNPLKKSLGWMEGQLSKHVERPLFGYKLPATKAREALLRLDDLIAEGMPREKALSVVADEANTGFGGMNYIRNYNPTQLNPLRSGGMDRNVDQVMRGIFLAPDWTGKNLKTAKRVYSQLWTKNPNPVYARMLTQNALLRQGIRAVTATQLSPREIDEQRATEGTLAPIGTVEGGKRRREWNTMGTATEWMRIPNQALMDLGRGDVPQLNKMFQNRFNPMARNFMSLFTNQDYNENPIYGTDRWKNPIPWWKSAANITKYMLAPFTHPIINNAIDLGMGNIGPEQAAAQAFEFPLNYRYIRQGRGRTSNPFSLGSLGSFKF